MNDRIVWALNRLYRPERPLPKILVKEILSMCREGGEQAQIYRAGQRQ